MRLVENSEINIQDNESDPYNQPKKKNRRPQSAKVDNSKRYQRFCIVKGKFKTEKHKIIQKLQNAFKNGIQDNNNSDISILSSNMNKRNVKDQNSSNSLVRKYFAPTPSKHAVSDSFPAALKF